MSSEPIRVGVIGAGGNTRGRHIPGLQKIEGVEIVGVCNRSHASSERVAQEFGIPTVYENWQQLTADPTVDAVVIGTWPYLHCRATLAALEAGKHVMCEARMATNAQEAHAMRDAARERPHLVAQIVPSPITLTVDRTVKRLIAEGFLGDILAIDVHAGGDFIDREAPLHWRQDFAFSGFNTMSLGIWYEGIMRWVGDATRVAAFGRTFVTSRRDANGILRAIRVPDHIDVLADMACGAQAHFQISSVTGLARPAEAFLFGSEGTLHFSDNRIAGGRRGDDQLQEIPIPAEEVGGWRVEEEFISAIRGHETITYTSFEDGASYMEFTEAALRSLAEGHAISLPL